jgi:hypothetical protein
MLLSGAGEMLAAILSHASDESGLKADWGTSDLGQAHGNQSLTVINIFAFCECVSVP